VVRNRLAVVNAQSTLDKSGCRTRLSDKCGSRPKIVCSREVFRNYDPKEFMVAKYRDVEVAYRGAHAHAARFASAVSAQSKFRIRITDSFEKQCSPGFYLLNSGSCILHSLGVLVRHVDEAIAGSHVFFKQVEERLGGGP